MHRTIKLISIGIVVLNLGACTCLRAKDKNLLISTKAAATEAANSAKYASDEAMQAAEIAIRASDKAERIFLQSQKK